MRQPSRRAQEKKSDFGRFRADSGPLRPLLGRALGAPAGGARPGARCGPRLGAPTHLRSRETVSGGPRNDVSRKYLQTTTTRQALPGEASDAPGHFGIFLGDFEGFSGGGSKEKKIDSLIIFQKIDDARSSPKEAPSGVLRGPLARAAAGGATHAPRPRAPHGRPRLLRGPRATTFAESSRGNALKACAATPNSLGRLSRRHFASVGRRRSLRTRATGNARAGGPLRAREAAPNRDSATWRVIHVGAPPRENRWSYICAAKGVDRPGTPVRPL